MADVDVGWNDDARQRIERIVAATPLAREPDPPRFGACVYCGERSGYGLACGACLPLLALDPTYADASGRMDETDYLPESENAER